MLMLGLDNSGKTTALKQLASEDPFVGGRHIAWEWASSLSPYTNENTSALFRDYTRYLGLNASAGRGGAV